eukprot:Phypoly_transcript_05360.p1 GENE.Phypoly_transcript_05360~~Phypoly_transcript_05360.p1  ORF type:complete len:631 (+),score=124.01 Phypoly_transcript_05360:48-1895(+)
MALTATATGRVLADVQQNLAMQKPVVFKQSFNRANLRYELRKKTKTVVKDIANWIKGQYPNGSGIVYCMSQKECEKVARILDKEEGIKATHYHAAMENNARSQAQRKWTMDEVRVIVATIAFGMGINKPDVRFVIHYSLPKSLEGYYQESGRAGRDGKQAHCILYYSYADKFKWEFIMEMSGSTSSDNKTNLNRVISYCENVVDCRRVLQLQYFGETFDAELCNKTCDNCNQFGERISRDVTADAKNFTLLVKGVGNGQLTLKQCLDIYTTGKITGKGQGGAQWAGRGKDWNKGDVERFAHLLIIEEVLGEEVRTGFKNSQNAYIKLGRNAYNLLNDKMKVSMSFRGKVKIPTKPAQKKDTPAAADTSSAASGELREMQQNLYRRLIDARKEIQNTVHANEYFSEYMVLSPDALNDLSVAFPTTEAELINIIGDVKARKYGAILLRYIQDFMDANSVTKINGALCIRGVPVNGPQNAPTPSGKNSNSNSNSNNANNSNNSSDTLATDLNSYRYTGPPNQSSHYFPKDPKRKQTDSNQPDSGKKKLRQAGGFNPPPTQHALSSATSANASAHKGGIVALKAKTHHAPAQKPPHAGRQTNPNQGMDDDFNFEDYRYK